MRRIQLNSLQLNDVRLNSIGEYQRVNHAGAPPVVPDVPDIPDIPEEPDVPSDPEVDENGYIIFADPEVKRVLLANGVGDGVGITKEAAAEVTSIGTWFNGNENITSFEEFSKFHNAQILSKSAFEGCISLQAINLANVTTLNIRALYGCTSLEIEDLQLSNLEILGPNAFYGVKIKKISDLGKLTALPNADSNSQNFGDRGVLEEVVLPDTLTNIPQYSFYKYAAKILGGGGVTSIGNYAFIGGNNDLSEYTLSSSMTSVGYEAFTDTNISGDVNLPLLNSIGASSFAGTNIQKIVSLGTIKTLPLGSGWVGNVRKGTFAKCLNLVSANLPETLTTIEQGSFVECVNLTDINIPQSVTTIGNGAFYKTGIRSNVVLPNLTSVGMYAFAYTKIKRVENLGSITTTPQSNLWYKNFRVGIFTECTELEYARMPSTITTHGSSEFCGCSSLKVVIYDATTPPSVPKGMFADTHDDLAIYVPDASVEKYKTATNWSDYADRILPLSQYNG